MTSGGILRSVPGPTADTLVEALSSLTGDPGRAAILLDVDGTLAPIVESSVDARVEESTRELLAALGDRYECVACISGRSAVDARRIVGVEGIAYAGTHGAELLEPGADSPQLPPDLAGWREPVHDFVADRDGGDLSALAIRIEDKGPVVAFHWRGAPDEQAAATRLDAIAEEAGAAGLATHWGRMVLEIRPPIPIDKGSAVDTLVRRCRARTALFGGDDLTDLDAFAALDSLVAEGALDAAVRVGVQSLEGPLEIVERADLVVDGVEGVARILELLSDV